MTAAIRRRNQTRPLFANNALLKGDKEETRELFMIVGARSSLGRQANWILH
jgi:hypothetical protein